MKTKRKGKRGAPNGATSMSKDSEAEGPDNDEEQEEDDMTGTCCRHRAR